MEKTETLLNYKKILSEKILKEKVRWTERDRKYAEEEKREYEELIKKQNQEVAGGE